MNVLIFAAKFQLSNYLSDQSALKKNAKPKDKLTQMDKWTDPSPMTRSTTMKNSDGLHRTMIKAVNAVITGIETC